MLFAAQPPVAALAGDQRLPHWPQAAFLKGGHQAGPQAGIQAVFQQIERLGQLGAKGRRAEIDAIAFPLEIGEIAIVGRHGPGGFGQITFDGLGQRRQEPPLVLDALGQHQRSQPGGSGRLHLFAGRPPSDP